MAKEVFISIIIPVYNTVKYLDKCISSILYSDLSDIEIILIDDGSTDGSDILCDVLSERYANIKTIHGPNEGIASARNKGIVNASGEYIAWVDSDDYVTTDWLKNIYMVLKKHQPDLLLYDYSIEKNDKITPQTLDFQGGFLKKSSYIYELSTERKLHSYLWLHVMKKKYYIDCVFDSHNVVMEDYAFLTEVALKFEKIYYLKESMYFYVQRNDSANRLRSIKRALLGIKLTQDRYTKFFGYGYKVSKAAYWLSLFYAYNIFVSHKIYSKEFYEIKHKIVKDFLSIMLGDLSWSMKLKLSMVYIFPKNIYRYLYLQKNKTN